MCNEERGAEGEGERGEGREREESGGEMVLVLINRIRRLRAAVSVLHGLTSPQQFDLIIVF